MKKFLAIILCAIMILSAIPITVGAETLDSGTCGDNLTWTLDSSGTLTISGEGEMEMVSGEVTSAPWEEHSKKIKKVVISYGVTSIGEYAFAQHTNLTNVTIPSSVTTISYDAFAYCIGLTSINIPNGVTSIDGGAFAGCSNLRNFEIPDSVKYLGSGAFGNEYYSTAWYENQPNGVIYCGNFLYGYKGKCPTDIAINVKKGVIGICDNAFNGDALSSVTLPDGLEYIGYRAFMGTGIKSIDIPNSVKSIGQEAFLNATNLKTINLSNNLEEIGYNAFYNTGWYNSYQSGDLLYLDKWFIGVKNESKEYNEKKISTINIKSGTIGIAARALAPYYQYGSLPESILSTVIFPDSLKYIGDLVFEKCVKLKNISLPDNIIKIGDGAFWGCTSLTSLTIPDGVIYIGDGAFRSCTGLTSVTIPDGVTYIGESTFRYCGSLNITVDKNNPNYSDIDGVLLNKNKTKIIVYAKDKIQPEYSIPNGVKSIEQSAFYGCDSLTNINIPDGMTSIGEGAFCNCSNLISVTIGNGLTRISNSAFLWCHDLTNVTMPNSITNIGDSAFRGCDNLNIYYDGDTEEWRDIEIGKYNENLTEANIHYMGEGLPRIKTSEPVVEGGSITITAVPKNIKGESELFVVGYDGNKLTASEKLQDGAATLPAEDVQTIKVFCWDSLDTMRPLCEPKTITIK